MMGTSKLTLRSCLVLGLSFLLLGVAGCSEDAEKLYEIAEVEEERDNDANARKLYERIIEIDPKGYFATKARERLAELDKKGDRSDRPQR